jgi:hypothetical protein
MAHVGGWQQFCADLHLDPEALLHCQIGWELLAQTEKTARALVFAAEEAAQFRFRETDAVAGAAPPERGPAPVETVAEVVRAWHAVLDDLVGGAAGR